MAVTAQLSPGVERPANLERRAGHAEDLLGRHRLQVPHHHRCCRSASWPRASLHQLAEVAHVVVPAGEAGGEQHVLLRIDGDVVAVAVAARAGGHRVGSNEIALVVVERPCRSRRRGPWCSTGCRPACARAARRRCAGRRSPVLRQVRDGRDQRGFGRVGGDVET